MVNGKCETARLAFFFVGPRLLLTVTKTDYDSYKISFFYTAAKLGKAMRKLVSGVEDKV